MKNLETLCDRHAIFMKYLIIGKNSRIICEIRDELRNFQFLSHAEMTGQNLNEYEKIFVFLSP